MSRLGKTRPLGRVKGWANLRSEIGEDIVRGVVAGACGSLVVVLKVSLLVLDWRC